MEDNNQMSDAKSITQESDEEEYIPKRQITKISSRKLQKIPLELQIQLFTQVLLNGQQIKEVALNLDMNYSSAKSLIHYYKTNKRRFPKEIYEVLHKNQRAGIKKIDEKCLSNKFLQIEVRQKNKLLNSYLYFPELIQRVKLEL